MTHKQQEEMRRQPPKFGTAPDLINMVWDAEKQQVVPEQVPYDNEPFETVLIGHGEHAEMLPLHHGANHSYSSSNYYVEQNGGMTEFSGHRRCIGINIQEYNYLKTSGMSGNEWRKRCKVQVTIDGVQCLDEFSRSYENGWKVATKFIDDLELLLDWFPRNTDKVKGKLVSYREEFYRVSYVIVSQGCIIAEPINGYPCKLKAWQNQEEDGGDKEGYEADHDSLKVSITSEVLCWHWGLDNEGYEKSGDSKKLHHMLYIDENGVLKQK